jgi:Family of unknown function (DUF5677)
MSGTGRFERGAPYVASTEATPARAAGPPRLSAGTTTAKPLTSRNVDGRPMHFERTTALDNNPVVEMLMTRGGGDMVTDLNTLEETATSEQGLLLQAVPNLEETIRKAGDLLVLVGDVYNELTEEPSEWRGLCASTLARSYQVLQSVVMLASRGLNGDAMSVARTIVELAIDLAYIATDPGTLVPMFIGYAPVRDQALQEKVEEHLSVEMSPESKAFLFQRKEAYLEVNPKSRISWAGQSLSRRADRVAGDGDVKKQYRLLYDIAYADMCGASHSGEVTLRYVRDENGVVVFGPQAPSSKPVILASFSLKLMLECIVRACGLHSFDERIRQWAS